jgi:uncharacterized protein YqgC (DUF456 family)
MHDIILILTKVLGLLTVTVGVAGIVLPIIPGWVLIFIGLNILGVHLFVWHQKRKRLAKLQSRKLAKK